MIIRPMISILGRVLEVAEVKLKIYSYIIHAILSIIFCESMLPKLDVKIRGLFNKVPDFSHMGTFIDSAHMEL